MPCRLGWTLALVFAVATSALLYLFVVRGSTLPASDGRQAIQLSAGERDLVLGEMRAFLAAVQQITRAGVDGDVSRVVAAARGVGVSARHEVPASLVGKLPLEFKQLGFATHDGFDRIADDTAELGDATHALGEMAELMQNCVACHAAYRLDLEQP